MSLKVALIFPGQGSQFVGMAKDLYELSAEARGIIDKADSIIPGLKDVMFNGPEEKLTSTAFCQPAIFTHSVAVLETLRSSDKYSDILPAFSCGLSLGEYGALYACGALSFENTIKLLQMRSSFMEEACKLKKGSMAAVIGVDRDRLISICNETQTEVANFNSPDQIVITGEEAKVQAASKKLEEAGAKRVIPLSVSGAFHSSLMQSASEKFKEVLKITDFNAPVFPIISNVNASPSSDPQVISGNLEKQIVSSVKWVDTIDFVCSQGITTFIELGPGTTLKGLLRKINRDLKVYNIQKKEDIDNLVF